MASAAAEAVVDGADDKRIASAVRMMAYDLNVILAIVDVELSISVHSRFIKVERGILTA